MILETHRRYRMTPVLGTMVLVGVCCAADLKGQIFNNRIQAVAQEVAPGDQEPAALENGAVLKTDPDLESIMEKADRFRQDGNYRVATQLWQAVLQRSGDALYSSDGQIYFSMVRQVEKVLAELPAEGLAAYRVDADALARECLAAAGNPNDMAALNQVVRQYFVSSLGDDAAFRLGCLYLDRYDFIGARRLFEKIARHYPDPSVSMADVHARIAVCEIFLGQLEAAQGALADAKAISPDLPLIREVSETIRNIESGADSSNWQQRRSTESAWSMRLADSRRYGLGAALPEDVLSRDLVAVWQFYFEPKDRYARASDIVGSVLTGSAAHGDAAAKSHTDTEDKLIESWRDKTWRPAGELLIDGEHVFFKTGADLTVWNRDKINQSLTQPTATVEIDRLIGWRSVWRNIFEIDEATMTKQAILRNYGNAMGRRGGQTVGTDEPDSPAEVQLFGDQIAAQMSLHGDLMFSIEGRSFDDRTTRIAQNVSPQWNQPYRRARANVLAVYDARSGAAQWTLPRAPTAKDGEPPAEAAETEWLEEGGFMAAPIGYGNLAIVPVNRGGTIWVYALDLKQNGKTVWKAFLCDEPEAGAVAWSAINLSIDGSDLFINCGLGVVFVLDPSTGLIRFAKRYPRVGTMDPFYRRSNWTTQRAVFSGWSSDIVIPYGRQLINFASDAETIEAIDRDDGTLIWRTEMNPIGYKVDYVLGVYQDMLYAAGSETIVAYDLKGEGRMVWGADQLFDGQQSLGRGLLTPNGIFMPVQDRIYQFDLLGDQGKPKVTNRAYVDLGGAPVGNLYSDGQRLWVHGANRLYALGVEQE